MKFMGRQFASFCRRPWALAALLVFAFLLHIGTTVVGGLYADDFIHAAYFQGNEALAEKGLLDGIDVGQPVAMMQNMFSFFDPRIDNYQAMRDYGMLPWWTGDGAMLHFFRPLAALTHYLDYQLWPGNSHMMHLVSLLWYTLGLWVIYRLYRVVGVEKSVACLALLFVILDQSVFQIVTWIASRSMLILLAVGFFSVYAYHRSIVEYSRAWRAVSFMCLAIALFTAEGAIGICAYLGAYMFVMDQRNWLKRLLHITPFVLLTLAWRWYYQDQGYGAFGVDFYIDPGQEPLVFLQEAVYRLPGNFFGLFTGFDVFAGQVRPDILQRFAIGGVLIFVLLLWLLLPALKQNRVLAFFALGSLFALVPGLSIALAPRTMVLPNVGFAVVMAYLLYYLCKPLENVAWSGIRKAAAVTVGSYILLMHIVISAGAGALMTWNTLDLGGEEKLTRGNVDVGVEDIADKHIVLLNASKPFWMSFMAHERAYRGESLPASIRVLSSAFYPIHVERVDETSLRLTADPAFQLDPEPVVDYQQQMPGHYAYLTQQLLGLMRGKRDLWQQGDLVDLPEMTIQVEQLYRGKPAQLLIRLKQPLDQYRWVYWDMGKQAYQPVDLPEVDRPFELRGVF